MKSVEKQYAEEKGMLRTSISKQKTAVETDLSALKNLLTFSSEHSCHWYYKIESL